MRVMNVVGYEVSLSVGTLLAELEPVEISAGIDPGRVKVVPGGDLMSQANLTISGN